VYTLGWNVEGKRLASGSVDQTVRITRVDDHCSVSGGEAAVPELGAAEPGSNVLLSPGAQIKQEAELRGHGDGVTNLTWHPSHPDKLATIAGSERTVRFWDTRRCAAALHWAC
jgi:THO complex subunit 3